MKPLNNSIRSQSITKFLLANLGALAIVGFSIYSYVFIGKNIDSRSSVDSEEIRTMETFIVAADSYIAEFAEADNDSDRSKYSLELNRLILDSKNKFDANAGIYDLISERYKSNLKAHEHIVKLGRNSEKECLKQIEQLEDQIEGLEDQIDDLEDTNKELKSETKDGSKDVTAVKSTLKRIAGDIVNIGEAITKKDWCKGIRSGGGRQEIKDELKQKLGTIRKEILNQSNQL